MECKATEYSKLVAREPQNELSMGGRSLESMIRPPKKHPELHSEASGNRSQR